MCGADRESVLTEDALCPPLAAALAAMPRPTLTDDFRQAAPGTQTGLEPEPEPEPDELECEEEESEQDESTGVAKDEQFDEDRESLLLRLELGLANQSALRARIQATERRLLAASADGETQPVSVPR